MFTILHLSDLHRSPIEPVSNADLIAALLSDRDRYRAEVPAIAAADAIVISGDTIQGAALGTANYERVVEEQYEVAYRFLEELSERFLGGDRSRLILVPGNHDVCWNTAASAMEAVAPDAEPRDLLTELSRSGNPFRWLWRDRRVYRVADGARYTARLDAFWRFARRFYANVDLARPLSRESGFSLFELDSGRIVVAAFDSCDGNDCYSSLSAIAEGAIARSHLAIRDGGCRYELRIAVWHHSIQGPPHANDYMDIETVYDMIGNGYRLGLHGHQHRTEAVPYSIYLPGQQTMAVVSAGSLCAGARDLPRGTNRQYNVISIADDYSSARVHVRTMLVGRQFGRQPLVTFGGQSYVDIRWERARDPVGQVIDERAARIATVILDAERHLKEGDPRRAAAMLLPDSAGLPKYGRLLLIGALSRSDQWDELLSVTAPPLSIDELVARCDALRRRRRFAEALHELDYYAPVVQLPEAIHADIRQRITVEAELG